LKVAEPLKLTQDETKSIVAEKSIPGLTPDRSDQLSLPFENLEVDVPENAIEDGLVSQSELKAEKNFVPLEKFPRLIFFQIALQSLNSSTQAADGTTYKGGLEMTNMMLGLEWYSSKANKWYSKISLSTFFQYHYENILSYEGTVADSRLYEIGGGLHYSFLSPHQSQKFIPSIYVYLAKGQISDAVAGGERSGTAAQEASSVEGDSLAYGLGMGLKYFFPSRLCVQILGEYYNREDTFEADPSTNNNTWSRASNGPRIHLGIGYRF